MTATQMQQEVLIALFRLCRATRHVSAKTLAEAVGTTPTRAAACLVELEHAGLCDASRARLTMLGLATAAQLGAAAGGGGNLRELPAATPRPDAAPRALPLVARPSEAPVAVHC